MGHDSDGGNAKWMDGTATGLYCNDPFVVFMQSPPQPVLGEENAFRLYFGMGGTYVGAKLFCVPMFSLHSLYATQSPPRLLSLLRKRKTYM